MASTSWTENGCRSGLGGGGRHRKQTQQKEQG